MRCTCGYECDDKRQLEDHIIYMTTVVQDEEDHHESRA